MSELLDRITAARKHAEGRMERATFQADYRDNKELVRLFEDIRDHLNRPIPTRALEVCVPEAAATQVTDQRFAKPQTTLTLKGNAA